MTVKLYDSDSYIKEFTATVISSEKSGELYNTVLDCTAFFPEGGGQSADSGYIGGAYVSFVSEKDGIIVHKTDAALPVGSEVSCRIDWELRYSRMQSHTAEHILSGIVHSEFGYDNVGFHMSEKTMTVDFSGPLTEKDIALIEEKSNLAVYKNADITVSFPTKEEAAALDYRSKLDITEGLRIVTVDGIDVCACCAPHLKRSGEAGIIKILDFCPFKGGTRLEMVAGINAYRDYALLHSANKQLMGHLSAKREAVNEAVLRQSEMISELKAINEALLNENALLKCKTTEIGSSVYGHLDGASYDSLRFLANSFAEKGYKNVVLISECDGGALYVAASQEGRGRDIAAALNSSFSGKGGGKESYVQGKISVFEKRSIEEKLMALLSE